MVERSYPKVLDLQDSGRMGFEANLDDLVEVTTIHDGEREHSVAEVTPASPFSPPSSIEAQKNLAKLDQFREELRRADRYNRPPMGNNHRRF